MRFRSVLKQDGLKCDMAGFTGMIKGLQGACKQGRESEMGTCSISYFWFVECLARPPEEEHRRISGKLARNVQQEVQGCKRAYFLESLVLTC